MRAPAVYLYDVRDGKYRLYLGDYTTSEGLILVPSDSEVVIRHIDYDAMPQLSEHLAGPQSVETTVRFLDATQSFFNFECSINSGTTLSSHDDCECHFQFDDLDCCESTLRRAVPPAAADTLWRILLENPGQYVTIDAERHVMLYNTFDDYLATLN